MRRPALGGRGVVKLGMSSVKSSLISMGVYRPVRRMYDRFVRPSNLAHQRECSEAYARFVRPGDLCFDVGANVGRKSGAMLSLGARVVAVEPQPACVRELKALYGDDPRFTCVQSAVGREPGQAVMNVSDQSALSSLRPDWFDHWESRIEVEVTTLDRLIDLHGTPRYCKIDIEGFEYEALQGLTRPVDYLSFEYNARYFDQAMACVEYLRRFGDLRFNLSLMEDSRLLCEDWWDFDGFAAEFRKVRDAASGWGGEIYAKVLPPAS